MKNLLPLLLGAAIGAGVVYFGFMAPAPTETSLVMGPIEYNCELSGGTFKNGGCTCSIEETQTQAEMYDTKTGFCQSTIGGPAGNAFNASIGLPWGSYAYYQEVIMNLCTESGGSLSGAACICPDDTDYDKASGKCE